MRPLSITARLTLAFSVTSAIVLLVVGYLVSTLVGTHFDQLDQAELHGKLQLVRHALANGRGQDDQDQTLKALAGALIGHEGLSIIVLGAEGETLFATPGAAFPPSVFTAIASADAQEPSVPMLWEMNGSVYRGIVAAAQPGQSGRMANLVGVAIDVEHHREFIASFNRNLWLAIVVALALAALLAWFSAHYGLAPIRDMADVATRVSARRLSDRLPAKNVPRELVDLVVAFNEMLARLEDSFRRLSDFSSDLAHELRTPISNLMTQCQVALSRERSAEEYREALYSNLEEHERLSRTISDMLFLAKADHGSIVASNEAVDLRAEILELFAYYEAFAEEQGVALEVIGQARVVADRLMIRRALSNLLSNAIRHSSKGRTVRVVVALGESGECRISVENQGNTIEPVHLPRLFERFYRVDASRQKGSEGAGLGLAITRSIVEAHGGTIHAESANGTTRFEIRLPKRAPGTLDIPESPREDPMGAQSLGEANE